MNRCADRLALAWPLTGLAVLVLAVAPASGQTRAEEQPRDQDFEPVRRTDLDAEDYARDWGGVYYIEDRRYGDDFINYDSEPPYDRYDRHWRRQARDYRRARDRYGRRYYDRYYRYDRPGRRYHDDGWYEYYDYGGPGFDRGYWEGRRDGRRYAEWERRHELGRRSYADAMSEGLMVFRGGDYSQAVRNFIRAAKVNQGDPASRIHAAHAMVAIERYHEALPALRRAFQLQPKIAYLALDIRRDYGDKADFDAHLNALKSAAEEEEDDPALWLLLGYYQFYSGREGAAVKSLAKADALAPDDFMTEALLDAARRIAPAPRHPSKPKRGGQAKPKPPRAEKRSKNHDV